jgi:PIN domain nuclease of toxin-antitoxin system
MFLLDTCTLLWLVSDQAQLSSPARDAIAGGAGKLFVSAISAFEIGVKHARGKLVLPSPPAVWFPRALRLHGIRRVVITPRVALRATALPPLHNDPMDRMIVATAQIRRLVLLTPDEPIRQYPDVSCLW